MYDSLRWHYPNQVNGSKVIPSSQPVIQAPLLFNCIYNTLILTKMQDKNATSLQLAHNFCFRDESFLHVPDRFCIQTQA